MTDAGPSRDLSLSDVDGEPRPCLTVRCSTCGTTGHGSPPCRARFRWEDNEAHQLSLARDEPLPITLRDDTGVEHTFESVPPAAGDREMLRRWRCRFLLKAMGPRPRPRRAPSAPPDSRPARFRWADNFHLISQDLRYLVPRGADAKTIRLNDAHGGRHELEFGGGTASQARISAWRASVIRNVVGGVHTIFGGKGFRLSPADRAAFEAALRAYLPVHDAESTLEEHLGEIQQLLLPLIPDAPLRLQLCGPSFPDYMLSLVASSAYPSVTALFDGLLWDGRYRRHFTRASRRRWVRNLAASHFREASIGGQCRAEYVYRMWRSYCHAFLDAPLAKFRSRILRDGGIRSFVDRLAE